MKYSELNFVYETGGVQWLQEGRWLRFHSLVVVQPPEVEAVLMAKGGLSTATLRCQFDREPDNPADQLVFDLEMSLDTLFSPWKFVDAVNYAIAQTDLGLKMDLPSIHREMWALRVIMPLCRFAALPKCDDERFYTEPNTLLPYNTVIDGARIRHLNEHGEW